MRKLTNATNRNPYPVYEIRSLPEMMSIIGRRRQYGFTTIFRGHCDDRYRLTPSIARIRIAPEEEVERRLYVRGTRWMVDPSNWTQSVAEATMFSEFCRQIPAYREHHPADQWELLAIAQHHKLPTRLLDWTYNPYVAAWFAVGKPPKDGVRFGVVWMHVPNEEDYLTEEEQKNSPFELYRAGSPYCPIVFVPRHVASRIRGQSGLFTVHQYDRKRQSFHPLESRGDHRECMTKFCIPAKSFLRIRDDLDMVGINAASLFPDLDGLTEALRDSFTYWP